MTEFETFADALAALLEQLNSDRLSNRLPPLKAKDIADAVGASPAAVYAWQSGTRLPRLEVLDRLASALAPNSPANALGILRTAHSKGLARAAKDLAAAKAAPPAPCFVNAAEIARREDDAAELWVFKWNRRFLSGNDPYLSRKARGLAASVTLGQEPDFPQIRYVYPDGDLVKQIAGGDVIQPEDYYAANSVVGLKNAFSGPVLGVDQAIVDKYIHFHAITDPGQLLQLGIPRLDIGLFMIVYKSEFVEKYRSRTEVFVELPVVVEPLGDIESTTTYWFKLPRERADALMSRWARVLRDITTD